MPRRSLRSLKQKKLKQQLKESKLKGNVPDENEAILKKIQENYRKRVALAAQLDEEHRVKYITEVLKIKESEEKLLQLKKDRTFSHMEEDVEKQEELGVAIQQLNERIKRIGARIKSNYNIQD